MVTLGRCIWSCFFAWMPFSLQVVFGAVVVIAVVVMVIRLIALIMDAIPFL